MAGWFFVIPLEKGPTCHWTKLRKSAPVKRSRLHLDLYTNNRESEVERLIKIGATRYPWQYKPGDDFTVLEDPDGNLFCVVQIAAEK
jgi:hypothetical protein